LTGIIPVNLKFGVFNTLKPNTPNLTDEQISRESIYEEQIKRQL